MPDDTDDLEETPRPPRPQMSSLFADDLEPQEEAAAVAADDAPPVEAPAKEQPQALASSTQIPLSIALLQQTRRVRENLLPAWYAQFYLHGQDPAVAELLSTVNAMLSTADQAMMAQDVAQMRFIHTHLAGLGQPSG